VKLEYLHAKINRGRDRNAFNGAGEMNQDELTELIKRREELRIRNTKRFATLQKELLHAICLTWFLWGCLSRLALPVKERNISWGGGKAPKTP
jgi:hypothetical protein